MTALEHKQMQALDVQIALQLKQAQTEFWKIGIAIAVASCNSGLWIANIPTPPGTDSHPINPTPASTALHHHHTLLTLLLHSTEFLHLLALQIPSNSRQPDVLWAAPYSLPSGSRAARMVERASANGISTATPSTIGM